ncbi:MAG TPA: hypothetical protein VKZ59_00840 [Acidobacteriota bacterium]|nr:hypothetical protein [Acidobacteriota bacterium]
MNPELLHLVDQALRYSLWAFLSVFLVLLLFVRHRLRSRRKQIIDFYRDQEDAEVADRLIPASNQWQMAFKALVVSLLIGCFVFLTILFVPLPGLQRTVAGMALEIAPLRVTSLQYERFHEGFSLKGEVWNQGDNPLESVRVTVLIIGNDQKQLDEVTVPVSPSPLPVGNAGTFNLRYTENSPFLRGYQLAFRDASGRSIDHETGFDVR